MEAVGRYILSGDQIRSAAQQHLSTYPKEVPGDGCLPYEGDSAERDLRDGADKSFPSKQASVTLGVGSIV